MSNFDWIQILFFIVIILLLIPFLGTYMVKIFHGEKILLHFLLKPVEQFTYHISSIHQEDEMNASQYLKAMLLFNLIGFLFLLLILTFQKFLPFNPQHFESVSPSLAFNIAMSFVTNTNWQSYAGETTLSYFSQMFGLTVQNFLSAATGIAALLALIRGFSRTSCQTIGNFWVDLVRITLYLFIPLAVCLSLILVSQGVVQTLQPYVETKTLENATQMIPLGPVASQVAIKQIGTNGGGFFNTNSAHPFENPTPLTNILEMIGIVIIPAALVYTFGVMTKSRKHGWLLLLAMFLIWAGGLALSFYSESQNSPIFNEQPYLEGKETRLGIVNSLLWSVTTTSTSNGSVNCMHDSLSPLAGGVALFNIMLGELIFGGVGVGLSSMLMFVLLTLFLSGLMVGRTPEYMGKKIEKKEIQWVCVAILMPACLILIGSGIASVSQNALSSLANKGPHGLSEILYAFSSPSGNNGSAFAGLNANTNFYNITLGLVMLLGRLSILIPSVAIAGHMALKNKAPFSKGVFSTNTFLFLLLLLSVILIVGALTFFPALSLGPILEHFLMLKGETF